MVALANWYGTKLSISGTGTTGGDVIFVSKVAIRVICIQGTLILIVL